MYVHWHIVKQKDGTDFHEEMRHLALSISCSKTSILSDNISKTYTLPRLKMSVSTGMGYQCFGLFGRACSKFASSNLSDKSIPNL